MKTSPTKEVPPTEEAVSKVTQEVEGPAPEVNGHAEEGEEKEAVKSEQVKEKEVESNSTASADTEVLVICSVISLHSLCAVAPCILVVTVRLPGKQQRLQEVTAPGQEIVQQTRMLYQPSHLTLGKKGE